MTGLLKSTQNKNKKLAVLIDGEHYPDINLDAIKLLKKYFSGSICGIIFLGGTEKLVYDDMEKFYGYRVFKIDDLDTDFIKGLEFFKPDFVYDLSDEPVVNHLVRMKIASYCFSAGCSYAGPDFYFEHEPKDILLSKPSVLIIGTGKRIGKTAVSSHLAKLLSSRRKTCIVAMGRGGPQKPQVISGSRININSDFLLDFSRKGFHASSDYIEDALFSRVDTVGCRRCGGGFGGKFFLSNIREGIKLAESLNPEIIIIEGSGASVPPVKTDFSICVVGAHQQWQNITGYLGIYRILTSDFIFMTMCEEPVAKKADIDYLTGQILKIKKDARIIKSIFRPEPLLGIEGKKVFLVLTANNIIEHKIREYIEERYKCKIVRISFNLSNRKKLFEELSEPGHYDMLLTELKAASVDMVTEFAVNLKKEINYLNNVPVIIEGQQHLEFLIDKLEEQ